MLISKDYFDRTHGLYPFLDRTSFEGKASSPNNAADLSCSKPWCSLYYSVLAIGCLHANGGSFEPGRGEAWKLFSIALSNFSGLLILPDSLGTLQALTAMAIYGLSVSCLSIERVILTEASRRAQSLVSSNFVGQAAHTYQKTFWVLYGLEKVMSFHFGRGSVSDRFYIWGYYRLKMLNLKRHVVKTFVDSDISCPIPRAPEAVFGGFDWLLALIRQARLLSRTYTSLLSVGASCNSTASSLATIAQLRKEAEEWRNSIPEDGGFRPGTNLKSYNLFPPLERLVALSTSYLYHGFVLILSRAKLHHLASLNDASVAPQRAESEREMLESARTILELTNFIDVEPYTPLW